MANIVGAEEPWAKRFPPYRSKMEVEHIDEFYICHQQIVPNRVFKCCLDCAEISEVSAIAVDQLNKDRSTSGMPLLCLVKIIHATKQNVAGRAYCLQILFKINENQISREIHHCSSFPIYFFNIFRHFDEGVVRIKYEEISTFDDAVGGQWRTLNGTFMPRIGLQCSPNWNGLEAEQWIMVALEEGFRLFDFTFFGHNRGQISKAITKFLPLFGLTRADVFISAKINIIRPETTKYLFMANREIDEQQFNSVSDYAHFCVKQCIEQFDGYLDLCMVHYPRDTFRDFSDINGKHKDDRNAVYGVLENYMDVGTIRSIGVANFEPDHIEQLTSDGHSVPTVVQCEMHPFLQRDDLLDYCKGKGIFLQAHSIFAYKAQVPSYSSQYRRYSLLKNVASLYGISTSQLSLSFLMQRSTQIGAVFLEQPDDYYDAKKGVKLCQKIRKVLTTLVSNCENIIQLSEQHFQTLQGAELGKLDGRFTDCEQWKVI